MRPIVSIGVDRSVCTKIKIPEDGFTDGKPDSFGLFDRNFQRLTEVTSDASEGLPWVTRRVRDLGAALEHDILVLIQANEAIDAARRANIERFVQDGGKLLVLDSATNEESTSHAILDAFGMRFAKTGAPVTGTSEGASALAGVKLENCLAVEGGTPFVKIEGRAVASAKRHGKGAVYAIGFASRFDDPGLGMTGDIIPNEETRKVYEMQYELLRRIHRDAVLPK